ncbi:MAG: hypothetical protein ACLGP3_02320, partial [Acidobacteriota bacterium]
MAHNFTRRPVPARRNSEADRSPVDTAIPAASKMRVIDSRGERPMQNSIQTKRSPKAVAGPQPMARGMNGPIFAAASAVFITGSKAQVGRNPRPQWLLLPLFPLLILVSAVPAQTTNAPLPDISQLMRQVEQHQHQVEAMRENYTFDCLETTQEIGAAGQVKNTATEQRQEFFVNGHMIGRVVKKDGQALNTAEEQKEDARVKALVEKAEQTPPDQ